MENDIKQHQVALVVLQPERASLAIGSLQSIYEYTIPPFHLIYVDCSLPLWTRSRIRGHLAARGHSYMRCERMLYPNQARNMGIASVSADYLVFIRSDVLVRSGWLQQLLRCAKETGAGIVGPLYMEGKGNHEVVHLAGGEIEIAESFDGSKTLITREDQLGVDPENLPNLKRQKTGLVGFRCVLVTRECLDAIGGKFDESLQTTREHVDLCLSAKRAGFEIYMEPTSRVNCCPDEPVGLSDLRYIMFRWSEQATKATMAAFEAKWDVALDPGRADIVGTRRRQAQREVLRRYRLLHIVRAYRKLLHRVFPGSNP